MNLNKQEQIMIIINSLEKTYNFLDKGYLHLVLEDLNYDDRCIEICINSCVEYGDYIGKEIMKQFKRLNQKNRKFYLSDERWKIDCWENGVNPEEEESKNGY